MDTITLTGMEFRGYHGCLPEERREGQIFYVDAVLFVNLQPAGESDDLTKTVNYADAFEVIGGRRAYRHGCARWLCAGCRHRGYGS